jgi:hypothetical protein
VGCAGTSVRGAVTTAPGEEPGGAVLARFTVGPCVDRTRGRSDVIAGEQVIVQSGAPRPIVVEKRSGYDSLVIINGVDAPDHLLAQAIVDGTGGKVLRQITIPKGPPTDPPTSSFLRGSLDVVRTWTETDLGGGAFRATPSGSVLTCALEPIVVAPPAIAAPDAGSTPEPTDAGAHD